MVDDDGIEIMDRCNSSYTEARIRLLLGEDGVTRLHSLNEEATEHGIHITRLTGFKTLIQDVDDFADDIASIDEPFSLLDIAGGI